MNTSKLGIELIKEFEGLRLHAYPDPATGGKPWTIGYGTTSGAGVGDIHEGMTITEEQAEEFLIKSLSQYEKAVEKVVDVPMTQHQFDALVSFTYNAGPARLVNSSMVRLLNNGDTQGAANAFLRWTIGHGQVMPGLVRRRKAERELFLKEST